MTSENTSMKPSTEVPKKRGRKSSKKKDDPGYTKIDMSTMSPVSGPPIVTFRVIGR